MNRMPSPGTGRTSESRLESRLTGLGAMHHAHHLPALDTTGDSRRKTGGEKQ